MKKLIETINGKTKEERRKSLKDFRKYLESKGFSEINCEYKNGTYVVTYITAKASDQDLVNAGLKRGTKEQRAIALEINNKRQKALAKEVKKKKAKDEEEKSPEISQEVENSIKTIKENKVKKFKNN